MARLIDSKKIPLDGKTVEVFAISQTGSDVVESALRHIGIDPKDKNVRNGNVIPDIEKFTNAVNAELAKRTLRM